MLMSVSTGKSNKKYRRSKNNRNNGRLKSSGPKSKAGVTFVAVLALMGLAFSFLVVYLGSPARGGEPITLTIAPQSSTSRIAEQLEENRLIHSDEYFKLFTKITGADRSLKPGKYSFKGTENLNKIVAMLQQGSPDLISFTVPEGYNLEQTVNLLDKQGICAREDFLAALENPNLEFKFLDELPEGPTRLEGFLFPDTYRIETETRPVEIVQVMLDRFTEVYTPEYEARAKELDMTNLEVITLASIIEREAKVPQDRPLVSSVFHNRLKKGMLLQSCATVQYALGEIKPVLYNTDLQVESPYNTYLHQGLPPGPIAAPGADSIKAALYPAETTYLYFVAKPDGSHVFNNTLQEHNEAKKKYLP